MLLLEISNLIQKTLAKFNNCNNIFNLPIIFEVNDSFIPLNVIIDNQGQIGLGSHYLKRNDIKQKFFDDLDKLKQLLPMDFLDKVEAIQQDYKFCVFTIWRAKTEYSDFMTPEKIAKLQKENTLYLLAIIELMLSKTLNKEHGFKINNLAYNTITRGYNPSPNFESFNTKTLIKLKIALSLLLHKYNYSLQSSIVEHSVWSPLANKGSNELLEITSENERKCEL